MNVDNILNHKKDPSEDFYALLGCDISASAEQVAAEFKVRAKGCHPDKNTSDPESKQRFQLLLRVSCSDKTCHIYLDFLQIHGKSRILTPFHIYSNKYTLHITQYSVLKNEFTKIEKTYVQMWGLNKVLLQAKETLCDPQERKIYDDWRYSGIAMSYEQWRALKDSVKTSMHWATPRTSGRMLEEPLSLNPSPVKEEDSIEAEITKGLETTEYYEPIAYTDIPFRMATPPFEEWSDNKVSHAPRTEQQVRLAIKLM